MYTMGTLLRYGSETQRSKWLPQIAKGTVRLQAFGVTEPTTGSGLSPLTTGFGYTVMAGFTTSFVLMAPMLDGLQIR